MSEKDKTINQWVEAYSKPLLKRALSLVNHKDDAMDLVQETFISAASTFHKFQAKSSPLTWLQHILKNKISDFYRKKYRRPQTLSLSSFFDGESGSWIDNSVLNSWSEGLDDSEHYEDLVKTLEQCIESLPPQWLMTVRLYYIEEKQNKDVCQELNISTSNLWKILQRSRMQLRKCIDFNLFEE